MKMLTLSPYFSVASSFAERLAFAKQRIDALEQYRLQKVLSGCEEAFRQVLTQLPLILHYNSPLLPAYVVDAPCGIVDFSPDAAHIAPIHDALRSQTPRQTAFDGLYAMGSVGSITQTPFSDLDIWLCHAKPFEASDLVLMQQKIALIKQWAADLGVELSLFLMQPSDFRAHQHRDDTHDDHNGSAQHFFLLDEFYRSAIRLAGKRILWLHIDKQGQDYDQLLAEAVQQGSLDLREWIDFGDFSSLSVGEFFGASLWQLYKGISSPHKSLIKILLLERYAHTYPKTELISKQFKKLLLSPCGVSYHFDPYLAMLEQVTGYLTERQEQDRLLGLRRCFYLKAIRGQQHAECRRILADLARTWSWSEKEIERLNARSDWKVKQVVAHHQMIVAQLLQSYRHLLQFARKFRLDPSILPQDADYLMRQLYSAFESIPGKISLINECQRYDLSEADVTFIEVSAGVSVNPGWYLINHAPFATYDSTIRYIQHSKQLIQLIAWSYFNGLITANTQVHLVNQRVNLKALRRFITDLRLSFPLRPPKAKREDFNHPHEIRNLIVAVNLIDDPTSTLDALSKEQMVRFDPFNLGGSEPQVIGSISIIYRNMWNEILTQHFEGSEPLLKSLKFISNKIYRSSAPPQSVNVFCYSQQLRGELQQFVLNLVERCISVKTGTIVQRSQPQIVQMDGRKWELVFNRQQELKQVIAQQPARYISPMHPVPQEIYTFASEGFLQFFFEDNPDGSFNVYVLDQQNKVECYHYCQGEKSDKIKEISRLHTEKDPADSPDFSSFNFPQFYQLLPGNGQRVIVPFQSKQHRDFLANSVIKAVLSEQPALG